MLILGIWAGFSRWSWSDSDMDSEGLCDLSSADFWRTVEVVSE